MSADLSIIINYIKDSLRFGDEINIENVNDILKRCKLSDYEKNIVLTEFNLLYVKGSGINESFKEKISRLFKHIGPNQELDEKELNKWFEIENIDNTMQKKISDELKKLGYIIKKEVKIDDFIENLDFLDELDFENLDDILESDSFKDELLNLKEVVEKSHNLEYLYNLHNSKENITRRNQALDNIVNANINLVKKITNKFKYLATSSFDCDDMYQAGMLGLIKAAEKFDVSKQCKFSTYAVWWIGQSISRCIFDESNTIRIPVHMSELILRYNRTQNEFWIKKQRLASNEEISELLKISVEKVREIKYFQNMTNLKRLNATIGDDGESFLEEFIPDNNNESPEKYTEDKELTSEINKICEERLTEREVRIINFRFGLNGERAHTLQEIGDKEKITRERIRQIEKKAIDKLKNPRILERLRYFYYDRE